MRKLQLMPRNCKKTYSELSCEEGLLHTPRSSSRHVPTEQVAASLKVLCRQLVRVSYSLLLQSVDIEAIDVKT